MKYLIVFLLFPFCGLAQHDPLTADSITVIQITDSTAIIAVHTFYPAESNETVKAFLKNRALHFQRLAIVKTEEAVAIQQKADRVKESYMGDLFADKYKSFAGEWVLIYKDTKEQIIIDIDGTFSGKTEGTIEIVSQFDMILRFNDIELKLFEKNESMWLGESVILERI